MASRRGVDSPTRARRTPTVRATRVKCCRCACMATTSPRRPTVCSGARGSAAAVASLLGGIPAAGARDERLAAISINHRGEAACAGSIAEIFRRTARRAPRSRRVRRCTRAFRGGRVGGARRVRRPVGRTGGRSRRRCGGRWRWIGARAVRAVRRTRTIAIAIATAIAVVARITTLRITTVSVSVSVTAAR